MIKNFGRHEGKDVLKATLSDGDVSLSILNYGAVTQDWRVPVNGQPTSVVLGFETFEDYPKHSRSFGIIAGRVANRTALGRFSLDGKTYQLPTNNGENHLHGGNLGLGRRIWSMDADGQKAVRLNYHSPDGEEGYPGNVDFQLDISLDGSTVTYDMSARPDGPTPINLAQHSYYNLGSADVRDHELWLAASNYTPVDEGLIPTGEIKSVADTHFDFRKPIQIGAHQNYGAGIDLNLVLDPDRDADAPAATVKSPAGLQLKLWTDQPGIQIFNAPQMRIAVPGLGEKQYGPFAGLCLEAQKFPDALNKPKFPSIIATPDQPYRQILKVEIN